MRWDVLYLHGHSGACPVPEPERRNKRPYGVGAVIVAAGSSRRMCGVDKILTPLMGRPLISYSLETFERSPLIDSVVVVASRQNLQAIERLSLEASFAKVKEFREGGRRRRDSVFAGLEAMLESEWTIVHDGARPLVDGEMIKQGLDAARETGAAVVGVPLTDTVKRAGADQTVEATLERDGLWAVQTPQIFKTDLLYEAHLGDSNPASDDAGLVERHGGRVRVFMGHRHNIKITTPDDLVIAESIIRSRAAPGQAT